MNTDLLPPLHDVEPPQMSVTLERVLDRSTAIRRTRRRRVAIGLVAAAAAGVVAVSGMGAMSHQSSPAPGGSTHRTIYGSLFSGASHDGVVHTIQGATYRVSAMSSSAYLIAKKTGSGWTSLPVHQTFDGGWAAQDGNTSLLVAVAPDDAAAAYAFSRAGAAYTRGDPTSTVQPAILPDGKTVTVVAIDKTQATPADVAAVGYRRMNGDYIGYGGGISGVRVQGLEVVICPKYRVWSAMVGNASGSGSFDQPPTSMSMPETNDWSVVVLLPANATVSKVVTDPAAKAQVSVKRLPSTQYQVLVARSTTSDAARYDNGRPLITSYAYTLPDGSKNTGSA